MKTLFVSPSYVCNEMCLFCPCHREARRYKDINVDNVKKAIDEAYSKAGIEMVLISGGEPTVNRDLAEIIRFAEDAGLKVGVLSNALKFANDDYVKKFLALTGTDFELTTAFHSHLANEHDRITGVNGSFNRSLRGIKNLLQSGVGITIKHVINAQSYQHLPDFVRWMYNEFPLSVTLVLCNMDICGTALGNHGQTAVSFAHSAPHLQSALDFVIESHNRGQHRNVSVFNTPLCTVDPYYWPFLRKYESEEHMDALLLPSSDETKPEVEYNLKGDGGPNFKVCDECLVKGICPGTWRRTVEYFGTESLNPIK